MEYRITNYAIRAQMIMLPKVTSIEDLRLIYNETKKKLICSTANKDLVSLRIQDEVTIVNVPHSVCELDKMDKLTIKCDYGDNLEGVKEAVENIDLTSIENKIQDGVNFLSVLIDNIDLSAVESKVQEESAAIQAKIDNIELPEIDTSAIAKQGENQDATNTAIYALLSQFGESVLQEKVTVILNCQESIVWQDYAVSVTFEDGRVQDVPLSENGTCSFNIKIGQEYSVQLPIIGAYIAPALKTYTAFTSSRQIYWSYVVSGVFGLDELGRKYTIEQIEALENKSIIKFCGFDNEILRNATEEGCGFMLKLDCFDTAPNLSFASDNVEFDQNLLPFFDNLTEQERCDGEEATRRILSESIRLNIETPVATYDNNQKIVIGNETFRGFMPADKQGEMILQNYTLINALYTALGLTFKYSSFDRTLQFHVCHQSSKTSSKSYYWHERIFKNDVLKTSKSYGGRSTMTITLFKLPK